MNKKIAERNGEKYYLLGEDKNGDYLWLVQASWDCDWYWGFGYVQTFTNNKQPERAKDINSHTHFDSLFFNRNINGFDAFKNTMSKSVLTDKELWILLELMKTFYSAKEWAEVVGRGGSHYTTNPIADIIINKDEVKRINEVVIPGICREVYKILGGNL